MNERKKIIEAMWDGVSDYATLSDMADGIEVEFVYRNKKYSFNSKPPFRPRIRPIQDYYDWLEQKAVDIVQTKEATGGSFR